MYIDQKWGFVPVSHAALYWARGDAVIAASLDSEAEEHLLSRILEAEGQARRECRATCPAAAMKWCAAIEAAAEFFGVESRHFYAACADADAGMMPPLSSDEVAVLAARV